MSDYTDRVERNLKGCEALSFGLCPDCEQCAHDQGFRDRVADFNAALERGAVSDEDGFRWTPCGICNSRLGGDRYTYHYLIQDFAGTGETRMFHESDSCVDCLFYITNGGEPSAD